MHSDYDSDSMDNDIALVFLDRATTQNVAYIKLNQDILFPFAGAMSSAMGWGHTSYEGTPSDVLLEVDLPVIANNECGLMYPNEAMYDSFICAYEPGKDTCQGDSGEWKIRCNLNIYLLSLTHLISYNKP